MRTYGTLRHTERTAGRTAFEVKAEPHVMMRLKRIFPRATQARTGSLVLSDTPDVARDLEWVLTRWPLEQDFDAAVALRTRADRHRKTEDDVARVLGGGQGRLALCRDPARPARPYQQTAADLLLTTRQLLVADEVGLGKTQTAVLTMLDPDALPAVVVCLTHLPKQWCREIDAVAPWLRTHIATRRDPYFVDDDVLVLPYSKLSGWADHLAAADIGVVVFDEVQEIRRHDSLKYDAAARVARRARYRLGLSATPIYNYGGEAHNIFQVLAPGLLGEREEFIRECGGA
jgi:SNF2 family DNA or RNA helicase